MIELNTTSVVKTLEAMIAEKEAIAAKELELLSGLKSALNRLGYDLRLLDTAEPKPADAGSRAGRRRGRPRRKPLNGEAQLDDANAPQDGDTTHLGRFERKE